MILFAGQVTNALIVRTPPAILDPTLKPTVPLQPFKRHIGNTDEFSPESSLMSIRITGDGGECDSELGPLDIHNNTEVILPLNL